MRSSYAGDPRWLFARYRGICHKCDGPVSKGDRIWYYPKGRIVYCEPCGDADSRVFDMMVADEDFMNRGFGS